MKSKLSAQTRANPENGKDPSEYSKDIIGKSVENGIDGFVKIELGTAQEVMQCPWKSPLDKGEFQLLLGRELQSFGYKDTLDAFEKESGVKVRNQMVEKLKLAVLSGDWPTSIEALDLLFKESDKTTTDMVKFALYKEIYLELLEKGQVQEAITLLRERIRSVCPDHDELQTLASWFLFTNSKDLRAKTGWPGVLEGRRELLDQIQELADPSLMTSDHYLANIIGSRTACYPPDTHLQLEITHSILSRSTNGITGFDLRASLRLEKPVTHISFCPGSNELAYGAEDGAIGYANSAATEQVGHLEGAVTKVAVNPDSGLFLASTLDNRLVVYDDKNSEILSKKFDWPVLACAWYKEYIVAASEDRKVRLFDLEVELIETLDKKANDVVVNGDLLYLAVDDSVLAYRRNDKLDTVWCVGIGYLITSMYVSHDGKILAVDTAETTVILNAITGKLINEIMVRPSAPGHIIRSCLASNFLVRGFYDPRLDETDSCSIAYVWSWRTGLLITRIDVSEGPIVAAAWDHERRILALASDDHYIYFLEPE